MTHRALVPLAAVAVLGLSCNPKRGSIPADQANAPHEAYSEPPLLEPGPDGVRRLELAATELTIDGRRYCLRAYNGSVPAPTIRIPEGTDRKVRINLHNGLSASDYQLIAGKKGFGAKSCHDFNRTNLHGHGLHVQPELATADPDDPCAGPGCAADGRYYGDDVLIEVEPGGDAQYRWDLDEDGTHHEGTDWYHPHVHGSTAIQVMNGAAGALIIDGPVDHVPGVQSAKERIMVLSTMPLDSEETRPLKDGEVCSVDTLSMNYFLSVEEQMPILVNGKRAPRLTTSPGQVERWRMIYAGNPDETGLKLFHANDPNCQSWDKEKEARVEFVQIARDGMTLPAFYRTDTVWLSPGYRVDSMIKMPEEEGTLCLVSKRVTDLGGTPILIVDVREDAGPPTETRLPDEAAIAALATPTSWTANIDGQDRTISCDTMTEVDQKIVLLAPTLGERPTEPVLGACSPDQAMHHMHDTKDGHAMVMPMAEAQDVCDCPEPNVSCRRFDQRRAQGYRSDRVLTVDTPEKWEVRALDGHPFHIHTNPFLVCPTHSNKEPNFAHWRDTYWVQIDDGARYFIQNPRTFTGRYMMHCHKLNHEDEGMMEIVEVCAKGDERCLYLGEDANGEKISMGGCKPDDLQCQYAKLVTDAYPAPPPPSPELCGK